MANPGARVWTEAELVRIFQQQLDKTIMPRVRAITDVPPASVFFTAASTPPEGFLVCDNSLYPQSGYPDLFAEIGTQYNIGGEAADQFRVPSAEDVFLVGAGGTYSLGATGGADSVTLSTGQLPSHSHSASESGHTHSIPNHTHSITSVLFTTSTAAHSHSGNAGQLSEGPSTTEGTAGSVSTASSGATTTGSGSASVTIGNTGSGSSHENRPPFLALTPIIKT